MLENHPKDSILFLDIETVPQYQYWDDVPESFQRLWSKKAASFITTDESDINQYGKAGIYAEFGKIICITVGMFLSKEEKAVFRMKSYASADEKKILTEFASMLRRFSGEGNKTLCAHNGKDFDFPYIARRMLIHGIKLPAMLDNAGKKPWEIKLLDTMELWKFGDYKHFTSLDLLTQLFEIPTPKDDIDGSQVAHVFYEDQDLDRIVKYCEKDVVAIAQLYLRWKGAPLVEEEQIVVAES